MLIRLSRESWSYSPVISGLDVQSVDLTGLSLSSVELPWTYELPWSCWNQKPASCQELQRKIPRNSQFTHGGRLSFSNTVVISLLRHHRA